MWRRETPVRRAVIRTRVGESFVRDQVTFPKV